MQQLLNDVVEARLQQVEAKAHDVAEFEALLDVSSHAYFNASSIIVLLSSSLVGHRCASARLPSKHTGLVAIGPASVRLLAD